MKKSEKVIIIISLLIIFLCNFSKSLAQSELKLIADKQTIEKGDEIDIKICINNAEIASLTLELYWDTSKLEYISGPEKSNYSNERIIYMWVNDNGENTKTIETENFVFKGLESGSANIVVTGEFYNSAGEEVKIDNGNIEIQIEDEAEKEEIEKEESSSKSSTKLNVLRIDQEGLSPDFDKDIKEYYFIADNTINNLGVTAIPENSKSIITINGNNNLKVGKNIVEVSVLSEDKSQKDIYKIYVTKTNDFNKSNADLEIIAIKQGTLTPEFSNNITKYKTEIAYEEEKIDILAIPQNTKANTTIFGNTEMNIGDNKIEINVTAEDGITNKKYEIIVHRRTKEEEKENKEEQETQIRRLTEIVEEKQNVEDTNLEMTIEERSKNSWWKIGIILGFLGIIIVGVIIFLIRKKNVKADK